MSTSSQLIPRPPVQLIFSTPVHLLAFGFGTGLIRVAPGTFGTLVGIPLFLALIWLPWQVFAAATVFLFLLGCWVCGVSARLLKVEDYGGIVFDEIVGYLVACVALLPSMGGPQWHLAIGMSAAFVLFRLFDILKPWPIRWFDRNLHGGFGIMFDDVLAGAAAGAVLWGLGQIQVAVGTSI